MRLPGASQIRVVDAIRAACAARVAMGHGHLIIGVPRPGGVQIRILFGQRDSAAVIQRSTDERIGPHTISAKIDHVLAHFAPLMNTAGIEIRLHETVLYNSIYRFDDEMIVNPHVYGKIASHAPALHLKKLSNDSGDLFNMYTESFDAVWDGATPHAQEGLLR